MTNALAPTATRFRWARVALGVGLLLRAGLALHTDIYFDEAYYWTWSRQLGAGYFDHPPLIAWAIRALGIRGTSLIAGAATLAIVFGFARDVWKSEEAGWRATALWAFCPAGVIGGFIATPDSLLLCFWAAALWAMWKERWKWAGLFAGLGFLSKYNAVLLGLIALGLAVQHRKFPRGLWWTLGIAAAVSSPVIVWQASHQWVGLRFQASHGFGGGGGWSTFGEYLLGQLAIAGPLMLAAGVLLYAKKRLVPDLLKWALAVPILFFAVASWSSRGEANWPAMAYLAVAVGAVALSDRWQKLIVVSNALLCGAVALHLIWGVGRFERDVPLERLQGVDVLAQLREMGAEAVYAESYQLASLASYYAQLPATTAGAARESQFDFWPQPKLATGDKALWVSVTAEPPPDQLRNDFDVQDSPQTLLGEFRGRTLHRFSVWILNRR